MRNYTEQYLNSLPVSELELALKKSEIKYKLSSGLRHMESLNDMQLIKKVLEGKK